MKISWTKEAIGDLDAIYDYYEEIDLLTCLNKAIMKYQKYNKQEPELYSIPRISTCYLGQLGKF